jgi:UDP:flavonoid glycosyltransferase YjiC (YdhE family)
MSNVLFLSIPDKHQVDSALDLASTLVDRGEKITFFSSNGFKKAIEKIGANFKYYRTDLDVFQKDEGHSGASDSGLISALLHPIKFIDDIMEKVSGLNFDYIVFSAAFPFAHLIAQKLNIPSISKGLE